MAYCRKCGTKLEDGDKFCTECGTEVAITVEVKPGWGTLIVGLILMVLGLTTLFGPVGTVIGLVISLVGVIINAGKGK